MARQSSSTPETIQHSFACLASHPNLATPKGATVEVAKARYLNCSPIWAKISTAKAAVQESQLWDCYQPALSQMVLNRDCAVQQSEVAKLSVATSFPNAIQFCIVHGKLCFFDC